MLKTAKLPIFNDDYLTETGVLRLSTENVSFKLFRVQAAGRPDGFRRSKYIAVYQAESDEFLVQGDGESLLSELDAITKAKSEAVERLCMKAYAARLGIHETSNGWAAHTSLAFAKQNAALELFERDAVLVHWLRAAPLLEVEPSQLPWRIKWWAWRELAKSEFPQLKVMITTEGYFPTVVVVLKNNAGYGIVGTASSTNLDQSLDSALIEACRSALHFVRGTYSEESEDLLQGKSSGVRPGAHTTLYAKIEKLPDWFSSPKERIAWKNAKASCSAGFLSEAIRKSQMQFDLMGTHNDRIVVKASSLKLQPIFWGQTSESNDLNFERIERTRTTMNLLPHVVG